jgi:hypothetical protein
LLRYLAGWVLITFSYFATLFVSGSVWGLLLGGINSPIGVKPMLFRSLVAVCMLIIPYVIAGIYARRTEINVLWVSIVPVVCERLILFMIGRHYVTERFNPGWNGLTVIRFIQAKTPAFYFSPGYIILGVASVFVSVYTVRHWKRA